MSFSTFTPFSGSGYGQHGSEHSSLLDSMEAGRSSSLVKTWDDLRKEARKVEIELDNRLDSYANYAQSLLREDSKNPATMALERVVADSSSSAILDNYAMEIKQLLQQLMKIKEDMSRFISRQEDPKERESLLLILHQYEGKYSAYQRDFKKSRQSVSEIMQQLLLGKNLKKEQEQLSRKEYLEQEGSLLTTTEKELGATIDQALEARKKLAFQNQTLASAMSKVREAGSKIPGLNEVMNKIDKARKRDVYVLAGVISACICFLLWWGLG